MKILKKSIISAILFVFAILCNGCAKDAFYPASDIQITKAEPHSIVPTSLDFDSIEDGVITVKLLNAIPCELVSYDLSYKTVLNEPIESLTITNIAMNLPLAEEGSEVDITIKPYQKTLIDLMQNSYSNISPVRATVTLHFKDVNKNEIIRNASFLLYKYENTSTSSE